MELLAKIAKAFKRQKLKKTIFLGEITVVPRKEYKRILEFRWESYQTDQYLKNWISESVVLSEANETDVLPENALILDILISGYQCGSSAVLWFDNILPIPIWWRPKIRLCGRLAKSNNCELIGIYHTIKAMGW